MRRTNGIKYRSFSNDVDVHGMVPFGLASVEITKFHRAVKIRTATVVRRIRKSKYAAATAIKRV